MSWSMDGCPLCIREKGIGLSAALLSKVEGVKFETKTKFPGSPPDSVIPI